MRDKLVCATRGGGNELTEFHLMDSELDNLIANPANVSGIRRIAEKIASLAEKLK